MMTPYKRISRRAELDMDRVRQWLKLDELIEKERMVRFEPKNCQKIPILRNDTALFSIAA